MNIKPKGPWLLTDEEWEHLKQHIPERELHGKHIKSVVEACLYHYFHSHASNYNSCDWKETSNRFGLPLSLANQSFRSWLKNGIWVRIFRAWLGRNGQEVATLRIADTHSPESPIKIIIKELEMAYQHFNQTLFSGILPTHTIITIETKIKASCFAPCSWKVQSSLMSHIKISAKVLKTKEIEPILHDLIHEMVHLWNYTFGIKDTSKGQYHNQHFRDAACVFGLICPIKPDKEKGYQSTELGHLAREAIQSLDIKKEVFLETSLH